LAAFWAARAAESPTYCRTVTGTERLRFLRRRGADGDAWHAVELARHQDRPYTLDYLARFCDDFVELHGDRAEGDDPAIVSGLGSFRGQTVAFVGHQKGRDLKQRAYRNFGMPRPEGYRKAMRVFELAGRLGFPVVTLIDTPGAYPGVGAEQRGQSGAIARSQLLLMGLNVPVVACVIGEGSSGGALAIGVADRVLMQQHTIYTVISPEGCAAILWKDAGEAKRAATALRPTAPACLALGVIDQIVPEPGGGAHRDHAKAADMLGDAIAAELEFLDTLPPLERRRLRRQKFERMGAFLE
jgi:acetyl-CoA carboxylase carboxyl transferase subunit alpha